jgi:AraC family transcriptional regulator
MLCYAQLSHTAPRKAHVRRAWIVKQTAPPSGPAEQSYEASDHADEARRLDAGAALAADASKGRHAETSPLKLLEDLRKMIVADPVSARVTALRLATLLSAPVMVDTSVARGGLAPWQQRKLDHYMRENLANPLRLGRLAELVNLSVSHFNRSFKASHGVAPHRYIVRLRLELAQSLMQSTKDPLCDIALACGLTDQAHLTKLFRRHVGQTPNAWRRKFFNEEGSGVTKDYQSADRFAGNVHRVRSIRALLNHHASGCE